MASLKYIYKNNKDLATFVVLNYVDKFLVFLLPLAVLYITQDRESYNSIEYVYSIANVIAPFFVFFSSYAFYGYKLSLEESGDSGYVGLYRKYSSFTIIILLVIGLTAAYFAPLLVSLMILIRFIYLQTINNNNAYYRLIDKPARFLIFTILGSLASVAFVYFFHLDRRCVLIAFFAPQLVISILCLYADNGGRPFTIQGFQEYFINSFKYAWPIVVNCTIVAFVMNYGKIYAYNYLSSYEMYNFSYIMRISLVIQMAHASLISFYGKELFVNGYSKSFFKKYGLVIGSAFILSVICLYVFNLFISDKLTIDATTFLILIYTLLYSLGASLEMWYGRNNQNQVILYVSIFSCLIFFGLLFGIGVKSLISLAVYMVIYALTYLFLLIMIAKAKKFILGVVSILPFNCVRIFMYRTLFGYDIDYKSHIGMLNMLNCDKVFIHNARIGHFNQIHCVVLCMNERSNLRFMNKITLVRNVEMASESEINRRNVIMGLYTNDFEQKDECNFYIGEKSLLTNHHRIDCTSSVRIGENVVIAGSDTQVWTHGFDNYKKMIVKPVIIGDNIYVGSRSIVCQGVMITNDVIIGAGTCVHKSITESGLYVSQELHKKKDIQSYSSDESSK